MNWRQRSVTVASKQPNSAVLSEIPILCASTATRRNLPQKQDLGLGRACYWYPQVVSSPRQTREVVPILSRFLAPSAPFRRERQQWAADGLCPILPSAVGPGADVGVVAHFENPASAFSNWSRWACAYFEVPRRRQAAISPPENCGHYVPGWRRFRAGGWYDPRHLN